MKRPEDEKNYNGGDNEDIVSIVEVIFPVNTGNFGHDILLWVLLKMKYLIFKERKFHLYDLIFCSCHNQSSQI